HLQGQRGRLRFVGHGQAPLALGRGGAVRPSDVICPRSITSQPPPDRQTAVPDFSSQARFSGCSTVISSPSEIRIVHLRNGRRSRAALSSSPFMTWPLPACSALAGRTHTRG